MEGEGPEDRNMGCGKAVGVIVSVQAAYSVRREQRFTQDMAVSKDNKSRPRGGA